MHADRSFARRTSNERELMLVRAVAGQAHGAAARGDVERPPRIPVARKAEREARGLQPVAHHGDRALAVPIQERESLARRAPGPDHRLDAHTELLQLTARALPELVVAKRRVERAVAGQPRELHGGDGATSGGQGPVALRRHDLPGRRDALDARELDPLDVADYGRAHAISRVMAAAARP